MTSILVFVAGAALLIYSAEKLIDCLVGAARGLNISVFLLAVVFTGVEFDDVFLGVALNLEDLDGVALGVVLGTAASMTGVVLALAAVLTPTGLNVPRDYVGVFAAAPLMLIGFSLTAPLTAADGVLLLGLSALFIGYVAVRESRAGTPVFRDAEMYAAYPAVRGPRGGTAAVREAGAVASATGRGQEEAPPGGDGGRRRRSGGLPSALAGRRSGWAGLGMAVLALAGLMVGAATTGVGTEGILETYGLEGTVFGATIATAVLTVEDIFLTVEPARRGAPEIGVGNVIGSVVFSVTGKPGIILLAGGLVVGPDVLSWHLPALIVVTALAALFVATGRLRRWHGCLLLGLYATYWVVSLAAFGSAPVDLS